jgi:hypothetical protein
MKGERAVRELLVVGWWTYSSKLAGFIIGSTIFFSVKSGRHSKFEVGVLLIMVSSCQQ